MSQTVATQFPTTRTIAKTDRVEVEGKDFGELVDSQPPLEREHAYGKKLTPPLPKLRNSLPCREPQSPAGPVAAAQLSDGPSSGEKKPPPPTQNDEDVPVSPPVKSQPTNGGQQTVAAEKVSAAENDSEDDEPPPLSHSQVYASQSLPVASYV